jgi:hypothetical protein
VSVHLLARNKRKAHLSEFDPSKHVRSQRRSSEAIYMGMHTISNQSATQHRMGATRVSGMGVSVLHGEQVPGWPRFRISCGQWHYSGTSFFDLRRSFSLSDNSQTPGSHATKSTLNPRWHQSRFPSRLKHPNRKSNDQPASLRNHILLLKSPILEDAVSAVPGISQHSRFCSIHRSCPDQSAP